MKRESEINSSPANESVQSGTERTISLKGSNRWKNIVFKIAAPIITFSSILHPSSVDAQKQVHPRDPVAEGHWVVKNDWLNVLVICANEGQEVDLYFKDQYSAQVNGRDYLLNSNYLVVFRNRTSGLRDLSDNDEPVLLGHDNIDSRVAIIPKSVNRYSVFSNNITTRMTSFDEPNPQSGRLDVRRTSVRYSEGSALDRVIQICR